MRISDWSSDVCSSDLRILHTPMRYPANYGFIPHTLSEDGDPLDALVVARSPFIPGSVVRVRPIAVLWLEDEAGGDEKLLTVPVDTTFPYYQDVSEADDLQAIVKQQIEHRSEEHTSELQSLMRNSYAVFCLQKKKNNTQLMKNS